MLAVNDLQKSYRVGKTSFPVLKGVSLTVNACLLYTSDAADEL